MSEKAVSEPKNMTFTQRCRFSENVLPKAPYRESLTNLHNEMLDYIEALENEYKQGLIAGFTELYGISEEEAEEYALNDLNGLRNRLTHKEQ